MTQVLLLNLLQIFRNLIDLLLFKDLVEEIYLNLNTERGGDTVLLHLSPLLLCLHLEEVGSQRSQNILIRKGDTHRLLLPLVILLKIMVSIKDLFRHENLYHLWYSLEMLVSTICFHGHIVWVHIRSVSLKHF